jgi:hypothetical protein
MPRIVQTNWRDIKVADGGAKGAHRRRVIWLASLVANDECQICRTSCGAVSLSSRLLN